MLDGWVAAGVEVIAEDAHLIFGLSCWGITPSVLRVWKEMQKRNEGPISTYTSTEQE